MQKVLLVDADKCTGCRMCEMYCSLHKTNTCNPSRARVSIIKWDEAGIMIPVMCQHCQDAPCILVCPVNALSKDEETGTVLRNADLCIGCQMCIAACPFGAPLVDHVEGKVVQCDHCQGEEGGPTCAQVCPTEAIKWVRADRVSLLKRREAMEKLSHLMKQGVEALVGRK